jgi:hypothetical protein
MKIKFSARETKRSTGRLPRRPAESVPHRNTLGGGERGSLATRVRRTLRRASRTTSSHPPRGARTARRFSQHHSRDNSGPHAGVRLDGTPKTRAHLTGCGIFPVGPRGARARVASSARAAPARARDSRGCVLARPSIARPPRSRASRAARVPRNAGPPLSHAECASTNTRKRRARSKRERALVRFSSPFPREFPFRDLSDFPKGTEPRERKPERKLLVSPRIKRSFASRSTRSAFLDPRGTLVGRSREGSTADALPPHCARAAAQDGGRVLAQLLARRPGPRPELRGKVRSRSALGRACLDARPPFPPLAQKRAQGTLESRPPLAPRARRAPPLTRADPRSLETQVTPHRRSRLADPQRSLEVRRAAPSPPPRA